MISAGLVERVSDELAVAFDGVYLVQLDVDEWGWGVPEAGFEFEAIPIFFRMDENGVPTGEWIDGSAWGPDTLENISKTMEPWFNIP